MIYIFSGTHLLLRLSFITKNFSVFVLYIILNLITIIGNFEIFVCVCYLKHLGKKSTKM